MTLFTALLVPWILVLTLSVCRLFDKTAELKAKIRALEETLEDHGIYHP